MSVLDEVTEGCAFCVHRVPETVRWSCGWCGRTVTYYRLVEEEEARDVETAAHRIIKERREQDDDLVRASIVSEAADSGRS